MLWICARVAAAVRRWAFSRHQSWRVCGQKNRTSIPFTNGEHGHTDSCFCETNDGSCSVSVSTRCWLSLLHGVSAAGGNCSASWSCRVVHVHARPWPWSKYSSIWESRCTCHRSWLFSPSWARTSVVLRFLNTFSIFVWFILFWFWYTGRCWSKELDLDILCDLITAFVQMETWAGKLAGAEEASRVFGAVDTHTLRRLPKVYLWEGFHPKLFSTIPSVHLSDGLQIIAAY